MVKIENDYAKVSLFDSILYQFGFSKLSRGREKAFTNAIYNSITLIIIIVFIVIVVISILQPFIKPLLWAVLCGSVLHPFKFAISSNFKRWLCYLENSPKPLSLEIITIPAFVVLNLSEFIGNLIISKFSALCVSFVGLYYVFDTVHQYTPQICASLFWKILLIVNLLCNILMNTFQNTYVILLVVTCFISASSLLWNPENKKILLVISYGTWITLACYVSSFFDYFRLPVLIMLFSLCFFGIIYESYLKNKTNLKEGTPEKDITNLIANEENETKNFNLQNESVDSKFDNFEMGDHVNHLELTRISRDSDGSSKISEDKGEESSINDNESSGYQSFIDPRELFENPNSSDLYLYFVCIGCGAIVIMKNLWLLYFIVFLFVIHITKLIGSGFGIQFLLREFWYSFVSETEDWFRLRHEILIPKPISAFFNITILMKKYVLCFLKESCDAAASVSVILALTAAVIFLSTCLCIQIYTESFYLVRVGGQIINQTVVHNPELTQLLPEGWENQLDSVLNSAYTYGREWLSNTMYKLLKDVPNDKSKELVDTALELWDRVYQAWVMTSLEESIVGPKVTSTAVFQTWSHFVEGVHKTPELINIGSVKSLVLENMAILGSGFESVWLILKGNATILMQAVTTLLSIVLGHGAALLGFFLNMIIFLTALFYLLNSSRTLYKPVEILTKMIPQYGSNLAVAMETASKEVIVASFKLFIFYGLWTWLIHNLFLMNITYLPSVLAAVLAVVPVLGTYWACLPGVLDLWLAQGKGFHALFLAIFQFLPTTIVDTAIYEEMHGGHPYLTGLAVAGGVLCLGAQGAIIGPLALCGLLVIVNLSTGVLKESSSPTS